MTGFERFCERIGLDLEPFQRRIAQAAFGPERQLLVSLPRGQGKTTLAAAISLYHLLHRDHARVYAVAASAPQASILHDCAAAFARELDDKRLIDRYRELRLCPDPTRFRAYTGLMRVLPAEHRVLHGLTPSLVVYDEIAQARDDSVYRALATALLKQPDAKLIIISTAGTGAGSPMGRIRARALAQPDVNRKGALIDARGPDLRMLAWELPEGADLHNIRAVKRANPASWITPEGLRSQREALPPTAFAQYHANIWGTVENSWLPAGAWQACIGTPKFTDGEDIVVAVDVGGERSATAVVWVNDTLHVGCVIYHGDEGVLEAVEQVRDLAVQFNVRAVVHDPWRFQQAAQELEREGMNVLAMPQSDARMIPASDRLRRAIVERRLVLPDDDEFAQHAATAIAKHGRRGWRLDKPRKSDNIDAVVSLAMALDELETGAEPVQLLGWL